MSSFEEIESLKRKLYSYEYESKKKPRVRTENASQEKILEKIKMFFNENKCVDELDEKEDFDEVRVVLHNDIEKRKEYLGGLVGCMKGQATKWLYENFIMLAILRNKYKEKNFDGEHSDGEEQLKRELTGFVKEKPAVVIRKVTNFFYIASKCKKNGWHNCNVAPSFWRDINNSNWNELINELK